MVKTVEKQKPVERETKEDVENVISKHPDKLWYIVQTASNCEKAAKKNILTQLEIKNKLDNVAMILIPAQKVIEMKKGEKKITEKKLYPGYIFILAEMDETVWHCINSANKVSRFVNERTGMLPPPIPKREVVAIINSLDSERETPKQKIVYNEEDTVRIKNGPFEGFNGIIKKVNYEKNTMEVSVSIFGRETPIEIGFNEIEVLKEI